MLILHDIYINIMYNNAVREVYTCTMLMSKSNTQ